MNKPLSIAVVVGSLRADGISHRGALALSRLAPNTLDLSIVPIGDLPLYNPDREGQADTAPWAAFRDALKPADGVLFVTPEYNRSVPAPLKNAIDVGSRPYGASAWAGKPAAVVSVSPGGLSAFGANHHLRQSLVFLDMPVLQQPEAYIGHAATLFGDDGAVSAPDTEAFLSTFMSRFADWVSLIASVNKERRP
ncbi:NAD(P)H-dependent oxidoreductase [Sphingomonas sp. BK235]|uniref:NADPH-dependent FMN reductase n=1 Tax=Sphingomonas sp. BK235 TaxID=2512131 RepID=UPI001049808A|nr:NAD(P)H-dependent oxidoreductase [Sphingomonas sp. BK235]TCP32431.1 chromate reductase [Sphingomonas sp. BK235]